MKPDAELDIVVYGATGYTGRLAAEHLAATYPAGGELRWGLAGRSPEKLAKVRGEAGAPADTPLIVADSEDPASIRRMVERTKAVISTAGPYQLYGSPLVAACAAAGTDYLDLTGEVNWMRQMYAEHEAQAKASGARILFSCGFDCIPSEIGVWLAQEEARRAFGHAVQRVKGRVRWLRCGMSGGSAASGKAIAAATQKNPSLVAEMANPFALTPGFEGPPQPASDAAQDDPDLGPVVPFMLAAINAKIVHRSNLLMGHAYGSGFLYDEMTLAGPDVVSFIAAHPSGQAFAPGEGPTAEERATGGFDMLFIGLDADGRQVKASVSGARDPGYELTSKMLAETAACLIGAPDVPGGMWTPVAALQGRLAERLQARGIMKFAVEA